MIEAPLTGDLGVLETTRVIVYYDGPRLFTVRSSAGQSYLVFSVDESEDDASETYLYVALSEVRLERLLSGKEALRSALTDPPDDRVYADVVS